MSSSPDVPRHLRSPGDDGYRTPTIEDSELNLPVLRGSDSRGSQARGVQSTAIEQLHRRATDCGNRSGHNSIQRTPTGYSAKTLSWKKRIRHVTWAYFTSTMATGGLANVLYEGILLAASHRSGLIPSSPLPFSRSRYNWHCCLLD